MKQGGAVPEIGVAGWRWKPEMQGMYAMCDEVWLACSGPDAGLTGFNDESDYSPTFHEPSEVLRAAQALVQSVAIWRAVKSGRLRVPAMTTRPRTAAVFPLMSWRLMKEFSVPYQRLLADELAAVISRPITFLANYASTQDSSD